MKVLISKKLTDDQLMLLHEWGWEFDIVPALTIAPVEVDHIDANADAWIVSSRNSLSAVRKHASIAPRKIFVVGDWMFHTLSQVFPDASISTFPGMKPLAQKLAAQSPGHIVYFCADYHRADLEDGLRSTSIKITKVITHTSSLTTPQLTKQYDVVVVFSPRSVDSLFTHNHFDKKVLFACIGPTTERYLKEKGINNTFCASAPDAGVLLPELHAHFIKETK